MDGTYEGYAYDYLKEISYYSGWKYKFIHYKIEQLNNMLVEGEIDLYFTADDKWKASNELQGKRIGMDYGVLYIRSNNQEIYYDDVNSLNQLRIGYWESSPYMAAFEKYSQKKGLTYEKVCYRSVAQMLEALDNNEVDAAVVNSLCSVGNDRIAAMFDPQPLNIVTRKNDEGLLQQLQSFLKKIESEHNDFIVVLYEKYRNRRVNSLAFTREEGEFIRRPRSIKLFLWQIGFQ